MFVAFILTYSILGYADALECTVNINSDLATPQPLYFYYNTTDFVTTVAGTSGFELDAGQQIELFCTDNFRPPFDQHARNGSIIATCIRDKIFQIENASGTSKVRLNDLACINYPYHTTRVVKRTCSVGKIIEIGFNVRDAWVPVFEVCHDRKTSSTKWAHQQLKPHNAFHQRNIPRIFFIQGRFYPGLRVGSLYSNYIQRKTIGQILRSEAIAAKLIQNGTDFFLARGHLVAKADHVFAAHQLATFYYINAAPQWQTFNGGNWMQVEIGIKEFIEKRNIDTDVYTGTHGIFTYPDINDKHQEIYLSVNKTTGKRIPVPRFYYKIMIAESMSAGIVFIGVNDPYSTKETIERDYILCDDVADQVRYIKWNRKNITAGYSYACSVPNFVRVVKDLPKLPKIAKLLI